MKLPPRCDMHPKSQTLFEVHVIGAGGFLLKLLANSTRICYTYDELSRVVGKKTETDDGSCEFSHHTFMYDAAGNLLNDTEVDTSFVYDTNNRLTKYNGKAVAYDLDGNMLSDGVTEFVYDSTNKLISAGNCTYTYNGDNVRIKNLCGETETTYVYDTNARLSRLLVKNTDGVITKYVYGRGLIGEENVDGFKVYHYDYRGSTVALTDINGNITDTFAYDTYGKLIERTGTNKVIFGYNGRDGVVTDDNGLIYMRARYYSPDMRRFVNADIIHGEISDSTSLNRYAYVNGNPVSFVDPFGLSAERGTQRDYYVLAGISPWGTPNTHVTVYEGYWKERWYGPDGKAVRDKHWSTHGSEPKHTNPHYQDWNWSNPEHPDLDDPYPPLDNEPKDPPSSEGSEPWTSDDSSETSQKDENEDSSNRSISIGYVFWGATVIVVSTIAIVWVAGNDVTGAGTADDGLLVPLIGFFEHGLKLAFGY